MVRNRPGRAGTPYAIKNKAIVNPRCMYCGRLVEVHYQPCWKVEPAQTTVTTTEEAKERSRRILDAETP